MSATEVGCKLISAIDDDFFFALQILRKSLFSLQRVDCYDTSCY